MARASHGLIFLFIAHLVIATAGLLPTPFLCDSCVGVCQNSCEKEMYLSLFLHQVDSGPTSNQGIVVGPGLPNSFGLLAVSDWEIVDAAQANANVVARAKGTHIQATKTNGVDWFSTFTMVFQDARFKGSTLQVMGTITSSPPDGELAIVGGTGKLSMARGTIKYKFPVINNGFENYRQLDIHTFYTPPAV